MVNLVKRKLLPLSSIFFFGIAPPIFASSIPSLTPILPFQSTKTSFSESTRENSGFISSPSLISGLKSEVIGQVRDSMKSGAEILSPESGIAPQKPLLPNPTIREVSPILEIPRRPLPEKLRNPEEVNPTQPRSEQIQSDEKKSDEAVCANNNIENIKVIRNNTDILKQKINETVEKYCGRVLSPVERMNLRDEITLLYIQNGYITSKAELVESNNLSRNEGAKTQTTVVRIIEGILKKNDVKVEFADGTNPDGTPKYSSTDAVKPGLRDYVREQLQPVLDQSPLNVNKLEEQLKLLGNNRLFYQNGRGVEAFLKSKDNKETKKDEEEDKNKNEGESELIVKIKENKYDLSFEFSNYAPPSTGAERLRMNLYVGSPFTSLTSRNKEDYGDELFLGLEFKSALPSTVEKKVSELVGSTFESASFNYFIPRVFGSTSEILQLRGEWNFNEIVQKPFIRSNFRAESQLYGIGYRKLLKSTFRNELAWYIGYTFQRGQTFVFNTVGFPFGIGPDEHGISQTSVLNLGFDYTHRDRSGRWLLGARLNWGIGLLSATKNVDSIPDGRFLDVLGQVQRVQSLGASHLLVAQVDFQFSSNSLLPSQQFAIGGQLLRGYRQNVRSADNGFRFSLEDNITIVSRKNDSDSLIREPVLRIIPFIDVGTVWNHPGNPNELPQPNFLASVGLGISWRIIQNLELRMDYGFPLIDLTDHSSNLQDKGILLRFNYNL